MWRAMSDLGAMGLREAVLVLWGRRHEDVLDLVESQWPFVVPRWANKTDAETCRLAMLSAASIEREHDVSIWRARAMAGFALSGWSEGVGSIVMTEAFRAFAQDNEQFPEGKTVDVLRPSPTAELIIRELEPFTFTTPTSPGFGPTPATLSRWVSEKSGFLALVAGRFDDAEAHYDAAIVKARSDPRGEVKVVLGRELVRYLRSIHDGSSPLPSIQASESLVGDPRLIKAPDVEDALRANLVEMRAGTRRVHPYEDL
jgi:hypothetical protein